jgi:hypothetical protein
MKNRHPEILCAGIGPVRRQIPRALLNRGPKRLQMLRISPFLAMKIHCRPSILPSRFGAGEIPGARFRRPDYRFVTAAHSLYAQHKACNSETRGDLIEIHFPCSDNPVEEKTIAPIFPRSGDTVVYNHAPIYDESLVGPRRNSHSLPEAKGYHPSLAPLLHKLPTNC